MADVSFTIELVEPGDILGAIDHVIDQTAGNIKAELQEGAFNIDNWEYRRFRSRPTSSPAQDAWEVKRESGNTVIQNATKGRRGRGPYVGYIHYGRDPKRPTVMEQVLADRLEPWTQGMAGDLAAGIASAMVRG